MGQRRQMGRVRPRTLVQGVRLFAAPAIAGQAEFDRAEQGPYGRAP